jgi:hypothetical protein
MHVWEIKEIQLGLVILFVFFITSFFSGLDLHMVLTHMIVLVVTGFILIVLMLNLVVLSIIPHNGRLTLIHEEDEWFINAYKMIYFILFFTICTLISSLINYSLYMDRSQNIFTLGMFIANIYYLIIALWTSLSFFLMSAEKEMMDFTKKDFLDK